MREKKIESQLFRKLKATFLGPAYRVENGISQENVYLYTLFFFAKIRYCLYGILPQMQHQNRKEWQIFFFFHNQNHLGKELGQTMDHICAIKSYAIIIFEIREQILQT